MIEDSVIEEYIRDNRDYKDVVRLTICKFIPSMKQLFRCLRANGIFIDTQDSQLKAFIQKCYFLANEKDYGIEHRMAYFRLGTIEDRLTQLEKRISKMEVKTNSLSIGTFLYCKDENFGNGVVVMIYSDEDLMVVKFENRELPTMCSAKKLCTVHDNIQRKLYIKE